jgi:protein ImuB
LFLQAQPIAVAVVSLVPEGPPIWFRWNRRDHTVQRSWGPERIETGWWREGLVRRDYYRVETTTGERFWLYRQLHDGSWFLHGRFE